MSLTGGLMRSSAVRGSGPRASLHGQQVAGVRGSLGAGTPQDSVSCPLQEWNTRDPWAIYFLLH